jgi:transposase
MLPTMSTLVDRLLPDALWQRIQPLLPPAPARPRGGVPRRVPDRNCVAALLFMVRTSTPWALLPAKELDCGSATTCWRRLDEWAKAGVFDQLQVVLLDELGEAGRIALERVSVDSFSLRAVKGGDLTGANPVDRGKQGSKLHLAGERGGLPISVVLSAANTGDSTMFEAVLDDIPPIRMPTGRRRRRPTKGPRRQGLRPSSLPPLPPPTWHRPPDRPAHDRAVGPAGPSPLDHRTDRRVAGWLPAAADPL